MASSPIVVWRGVRVCQCVIDSVEKVVEPRMKAEGVIHNSIDIFQGGYNAGGVAASAGTHDGGGVLDVAQFTDKAVRIWRESGWALWHRTPAQGFMHHGHGVLIGCPHPSSGALYQVEEYRAGRNGLANRAADDGPRISPIITYKQAIAKYAGGTVVVPKSVPVAAGGEPADTSEGGLIMPNPVKFHRAQPQKFATSKSFQTVQLADKKGTVSILSGPGTIYATAYIVSDIDTWARFVAVDYKKGEPAKIVARHPRVRILAGGDQVEFYDTLPTGAHGADRRLRLQILAWSRPVTLNEVLVRAGKA